MKTHSLAAPWVLLALIALLPGCAPSGVKVSGSLVVNGKPYKPGNDLQVDILFLPESDQSQVPNCAAEYNPEDGSFVVAGPEGRGVPPGRYKVAVATTRYSGEGSGGLGDAFSADKTPLTYEVTRDGTQRLQIDLTRRTVTRQ